MPAGDGICALERSACALLDASSLAPGAARSALLLQARNDLQQAGALLADIDGVALLTPALALALQRFGDGTLTLQRFGDGALALPHSGDDTLAADAAPLPAVQTVLDLMLALSDYVAQLRAGAPPQPLRLFPYYRALQQMLGAALSHPAELFFPDLTLAVVLPSKLPSGLPTAPAPDDPAWRQRFEKALLPFLKEGAGPHALALHDVIAQVAEAQLDAPARTFWGALTSVAELVATGQLASGQHVKQLFGLINLQLRRLSNGDNAPHAGVLRAALFFIAASAAPGGQVAALRQGYRLAGMVPADLEQRTFAPRSARRELAVRVDAPVAGARVALLRVRADWLERIGSQAGFVGAAQQTLAADINALRAGMQDFSSSLGRLRLQLREVEAQAVAQLAARMAVCANRDFDPLEFDRCTRLQQLARMMADSVNQVTVDHQDLIDGAERASSALQQQAQLAASLQHAVLGLRQRPARRALRARGALQSAQALQSSQALQRRSAQLRRRVKARAGP